jgi:hypothetical protein
MIKIELQGAEECHRAATWCENNLVYEDWEMWLSVSSWTRYTFEFKNPKDATLFSLAWAQYASK